MGLFDKLFAKTPQLEPLHVEDGDIVAIADGRLKDIKTVSDPMFAEEMLGKSVAFEFEKNSVILCSPANGKLSVLFPTGHAFGITMEDGTALLVHCGVDTVNAKGEGFKLQDKKQGDDVKAGDPIVKVDVSLLKEKYDMSTMLIITDNPKNLEFKKKEGEVKRGDSLI